MKNTYIEKLLREAEVKASKDMRAITADCLKNVPESDCRTGYEHSYQEQVRLNRIFAEKRSQYFKEAILPAKLAMEKLLDMPEFGTFLNLVMSIEPEFEFSRFMEQMAFDGYKRQIMDEIKNLPVNVIQIYDENKGEIG